METFFMVIIGNLVVEKPVDPAYGYPPSQQTSEFTHQLMLDGKDAGVG